MVSKVLTKCQCNYAVIEKEMLAICFGCSKFHESIFCQEVTIEIDKKPLINIMNNSPANSQASEYILAQNRQAAARQNSEMSNLPISEAPAS